MRYSFRMRCLTAALCSALLLACASKAVRAPDKEQAAQDTHALQDAPPAKPVRGALDDHGPAPAAPTPELQAGMQPKPGERVRQPLLDEHCGETSAPIAFYYHGGRPFAQRAVSDGCRPLYLLECLDNGACTESREQETGMWCCADPTQHTAHAERR